MKRAALTGLLLMLAAMPVARAQVPVAGLRDVAPVVVLDADGLYEMNATPRPDAARTVAALRENVRRLGGGSLATTPFALSVSAVLCDEMTLLGTREARAALQDIRRLARGRVVLSVTYAHVPLRLLRPTDVAEQISEGRRAVRDCTGAEPADILLPEGLSLPDEDVQAALRRARIRRAISAFAVPPATTRPTIVPAVELGAEIDTSIVANTRPEAPALAVITDDWRALARLASDETLRLRRVSALTHLDVPGGLIAADRPVSEEYREDVEDARRALDRFGTFALPDNPRIAIYRTIVARITADVGSRAARAFVDTVEKQFDAISVADGSVTFTSRRGSVPVTISNRAPYPVQVTVAFRPSTKLYFPERSRIVTVYPPGDTVTFEAVARSTGTFPTEVVVTSAGAGSPVVFDRAELSVRSAAANLSALILTFGGAAFLLVWVVRRVRKRRIGPA